MKGYGSSLAPVHAGIKYDLEQLLLRFKERDSYRFRSFSEVFRSMEMNLIFAGRQSAAELIEFSERLLQTAASYMMSVRGGPRSKYFGQCSMDESGIELSLTDRIYGIYICYALYYLQPVDYVVQIRLTPSQMCDLTDFVHNRLLPERHLDTVACVFKLIDDGAFKIVAFEACYDPVCHRRYDLPDMDEEAIDETIQPFSFAKSVIDDALLKQIEIVHRRYEQGKRDLKVQCASVTKNDFVEEIKTIYAESKVEFEERQRRIEQEVEVSNSPRSLSVKKEGESSRISIKEAAYSSKIVHSRSRRYADPEMIDNFAGTSELVISDKMCSKSMPDSNVKGTRRRKNNSNDLTNESSHKIAHGCDQLTIGNSPPNKFETTIGKKRNRKKKETLNAVAKKEIDEAIIERDMKQKNSLGKRISVPKERGNKAISMFDTSPLRKKHEKDQDGDEEIFNSLSCSVTVSESPQKPTSSRRRRPTLDPEFEASLRRFAETPQERAADKVLQKLLKS